MGLGKTVLKGAGKVVKGIGKGSRKIFFKEAEEETLGEIDKVLQKTAHIASEKDGKMVYRKLNAIGMGAIVAGAGLAPVAKEAAHIGLGDTSVQRGTTTVADHLDRFISYDGSGFVQNANQVAGGNIGVLNDMVEHTFRQASYAGIGSKDVSDIVFALHNSREG